MDGKTNTGTRTTDERAKGQTGERMDRRRDRQREREKRERERDKRER